MKRSREPECRRPRLVESKVEVGWLRFFQSERYRQRDVKLSQRDGFERAHIVCKSGLREADQLVAMNTRLLFQTLLRANPDLGAQTVVP